MGKEFVEIIEAAPVIAAVKDDDGLARCLKSEVDVVFVLYGEVCTIPGIVEAIKRTGKTALVHIDLVSGLSAKESAVDFIAKFTKADGIITTKSNLISHAKGIGLSTVLRYFVLDSLALLNIERQSHQGNAAKPDVIEILPGVLPPKLIREICRKSRIPVICGGLIKEKEDVMNALKSGAAAISTTSPDVWFL